MWPSWMSVHRNYEAGATAGHKASSRDDRTEGRFVRKSRIKAKLARNEPTLCTTLHLTDPSVFELASLLGIDGIWMDREHHGYSVETAGQLMRAARVGTACQEGVHAHGSTARNGRPGDYVSALR